MRPRLTEKQASVLRTIKWFIQKNGYPPTIQEIADHFGWASKHNAHQHTEALVRKGYLKKTPKVARSLVPITT